MIASLLVAVALGSPAQVAPADRQKALIAKIQAERAAKSNPLDLVGPPVEAVRPATAQRTSTPTRPKSDRKAAYRRHNAQFQAEQAAEARAQAEYERKMAPIILEQQRQQREAATRRYEAELRFRSDMEFNDAIRGVTRARP